MTVSCDSKYYRRYWFSGIAWFCLGFGSASFHATQTSWGELLDELGMILASTSSCFALHDVHPLTTSRRGASFYLFFTIFTIVSSVAYAQAMYHPLFSLSFLVSIVTQVLLVASVPASVNEGPNKLYLEDKNLEPQDVAADAASVGSSLYPLSVRKSIRYAGFLALSGWGVWHVDQMCVHNNWPQPSEHPYELYWYYWMHPMWHILTAAALVFFLHSIIKARIDTVRSSLMRRSTTGSFVPKTSIQEAVLVSLGIPVRKPITELE